MPTDPDRLRPHTLESRFLSKRTHPQRMLSPCYKPTLAIPRTDSGPTRSVLPMHLNHSFSAWRAINK